MRRRRRTALLATALVGTGFAVAACGSEEFPNDPRPPSPIQLTAKISDDEVLVSPVQIGGKPVGAGLANITIANLTNEDAELTFDGPSQDVTTDPVVAQGNLNVKLDLRPGTYTVATDDSATSSMEFQVGPERPSAQNDLLLP